MGKCPQNFNKFVTHLTPYRYTMCKILGQFPQTPKIHKCVPAKWHLILSKALAGCKSVTEDMHTDGQSMLR